MNAIVKATKGGAVATTTKGALVKTTKGALVKGGANALTVMNQAIEQLALALEAGRRHRLQWESSICTIGIVGEPRRVEIARKIHNGFLAALPEMEGAYLALLGVEWGPEQVDRTHAVLMLNTLFAAIGKRKNDEEGALLMAAAVDMLSPVNDVLAAAGLLNSPVGSSEFTTVKPINRHPAILAIAVKKLIATAKFTSCAELREAMADVEHFIGLARWHLEFMTQTIDTADAMLFEQDRATWDAMHARVDAAVERTMLRDNVESPCTEDDIQYPGSPRWQALDQILKAKEAASCRLPAAACETKLAKRTRKPKGEEPSR